MSTTKRRGLEDQGIQHAAMALHVVSGLTLYEVAGQLRVARNSVHSWLREDYDVDQLDRMREWRRNNAEKIAAYGDSRKARRERAEAEGVDCLGCGVSIWGTQKVRGAGRCRPCARRFRWQRIRVMLRRGYTAQRIADELNVKLRRVHEDIDNMRREGYKVPAARPQATDRQKAQALRLRARGWTYRQIADHLGISHTTAFAWCKKDAA